MAPRLRAKGTIATRVAQALGWHYLDSGALLSFDRPGRTGVPESAWEDEDCVAAVAAGLDVVVRRGNAITPVR
jgi:cytidylate kinase